ncbi:LysE family translocator [Gallaecimonas xiamenensis]|uniref:Threonine efflux protein n=1 Tax=Gallaecimonas xiamenensis 3-C-1 TaxID=745411 RepID=K2J462_9GAMM|nr:LysE family transporter [Gallaecimonas xiamenensis]EKE77811.1 threonine efflux protein [Gallaecimonas xiamenensis 3-C-1]
MHEYVFILPIMLFLLLGVMSPGPSFLLVAQTAMSRSRTEAMGVAIGMGLGATLFAVVACYGLFALIAMVPWLYALLKVIGGVYLCFLAIKMWKSAGQDTPGRTALSSRAGFLKMLFAGFITQVSNPKTALVFGSAFAAFLPKEVPDYSVLIVSVSALLIDSGWYIIVAMLLSTPGAQAAYGKFKKHLCRLAGGFMAAMGVKLFLTQP